jgi:hypothetical protein
MEPINEIDISVTARTKHDLCPQRAAARCMAGFVLGSNVSFGLDDSANGHAIWMVSHQMLTEKLPGDLNSWLFVK